MQKIVPHLWFDGTAEDAARLYASLVPGSSVGRVTRYGKAGFEHHRQPEGQAMTVEVSVGGYGMVALNGGPYFSLTPAVSYFLTFETPEEVDRVWAALGEGGEVLMPLDAYDWSSRYGWANDRYGVSWQVMLGAPAASGQAVIPMLMFTGPVAGRAGEAMEHYVSVFPDSRIGDVARYDGSGVDAAGTVMHGRFSLFGETFAAMDSAYEHGFSFTEANSFLVLCEDQAEVDRYWDVLSAVPEVEQCGWLKDRFGVSWQIVPARLMGMMTDPDPARVARVTDAFMAMRRLDIAELERAYRG